jgi:hypothetical protein
MGYEALRMRAEAAETLADECLDTLRAIVEAVVISLPTTSARAGASDEDRAVTGDAPAALVRNPAGLGRVPG